jgi:hypothetical protein
MDLSGSGIETLAHLHEPGNARICVMFIAFSGAPKIIRLWGKGRVLENGTKAYRKFVEEKDVQTKPGSRSIVMVDIDQVASSCGFSVPYYDFVAHRPILDDHFAKKQQKYEKGDEKESIDHYWAWKSARSIDGLPGMRRGVEFAEKNGVRPLRKMVGRAGEMVDRRVMGGRERIGIGHLLVVLILGMIIGGAGAVSFVSVERLVRFRETGSFV